jgi:hypothetical protein
MAAVITATSIFDNLPTGGGLLAPELPPFHYSTSIMVWCERNGFAKDRNSAEIWCMINYLNRNSTSPLPECKMNQAAVAVGAAAPAAPINPTTVPLVDPIAFGGSIIQERNAHGVIVAVPNPIAGTPYPGPAIVEFNFSAEVREFIRGYYNSSACGKAAMTLVACHQTKELRSRNYKSFRIIFGLEAPNDMLLLVAKAYKSRFILIAGEEKFNPIRQLTPFIMYHTKAFSSAGVVAKAFEALGSIGITIPKRQSPSTPYPVWYPPVHPDEKSASAVAYYRALDTHSHTISYQQHVLDKDVIIAIATNEAFGQVVEDWKHGEKVLAGTSMAQYSNVRATIKAALKEFNDHRDTALAAGSGAASRITSAMIT